MVVGVGVLEMAVAVMGGYCRSWRWSIDTDTYKQRSTV